MTQREPAASPSLATRSLVSSYDWRGVARELDARGHARLPELLSEDECDALRAVYTARDRFRSFVNMEQHRFGRGDYRYFDSPLPPTVAHLRTWLYPRLALIANEWQERLGREGHHPRGLSEWLRRCHAAGQTRPTPLLLRYEAEGFNCLHQDLYGEVAFPLQVVVLLSRPVARARDIADAAEFSGGEFLLYEQRPRAQSRAEAIVLAQGEGLIFPCRERPVIGAKGDYRVNMKHGLSRVHAGERHALGIIFHDAM